MLERPCDVFGIEHDGLEVARVVARIDAPRRPKLNRVAPTQMWRLVDMAVQRQWWRVLLDESPQRLAADVLVARHLVERCVGRRRMADIDRTGWVAARRQRS